MAGINRFDNPAQAKFANTYVGLPLEELKQAGLARQAKHDENLSRLDAAQAATDQLNYIPNSVDQTYIEGIKRKFSDISDKYIGEDLSDPEIYRALRSDITRNVNRDRVERIQRSAAGYDSYQKELAKLEAQRRGTPMALRPDFKDYDSMSDGIFSQVAVAAQDRKAATTRFFDQMNEEFIGQVQLDDNTRGLEHGVTAARTIEHAKNNWKVFSEDPAGQEILEEAKALGDKRSTKDIMLDYLLSEAPEHVSSRITSTYQSGTGPTEKPKSIIPSTDKGPVTPTQNISGSRKDIRKQTPEIEEIVEGISISKPSRELRSSFNDSIQNLYSTYGTKIENATTAKEKRALRKERNTKEKELENNYWKEKDQLKGEDKKIEFATPEAEAQFNAYADAASSFNNITDFDNLPLEKKIDEINDYIKYRQQRAVFPDVVSYMSSGDPALMKEAELQTKALNSGQFDNRTVYFPDQGKNQNLISVADLKEEYPQGNSTDQFKWNIVGRTSDIPNQELANAKQVTIENYNGNVVETVFIAGSDEEREASLIDNYISTEMRYSDLPYGDFQIGKYNIKWVEHETKDLPSTYTITFDEIGGGGTHLSIPVSSIAEARNLINDTVSEYNN